MMKIWMNTCQNNSQNGIKNWDVRNNWQWENEEGKINIFKEITDKMWRDVKIMIN